MNIDLFAYSIIALICTVLLLGVVLAVVVISYRKSQKSREGLENEAESILNKAKEEALKVEKKEIYSQLQSLTEDEKQMYQQNLSQTSTDIKSYLLTEYKKETEDLDKQIQSDLANRYEGALKKMEADLAEYKKQKMLSIDQNAQTILKDFISSSAGKVIPLEVHQEFIINALEEAKKKNVF